MIQSNSFVIKLPPNFDINYTFNIKNLITYKIQQHILDDLFKTSVLLSLLGVLKKTDQPIKPKNLRKNEPKKQNR